MVDTGRAHKADPASQAVAPERAGAIPGVARAAQVDADCVAAVLAGHRQRFAELIERYQNAVCAVVRGYVSDTHAAEDTAQEVFLKAFSSLATLREPGLFFPWLLQIARNAASQAGMRADRRPDRFPLEDRSIAPAEPPQSQPAVTRVLGCVEQLPEPYRSTIFLKYQQNLSCREIAEREGVAVSTITSRLSRGLAILRSALQEQK